MVSKEPKFVDWYLTGNQSCTLRILKQLRGSYPPSNGIVVHVHFPQTTHHLELVTGRFRRAALIFRTDALQT